MPILHQEVTLSPFDLLDEERHDASESKWRVLYTKPRHEKSVARHLHAQDAPFYLPLQRKIGYFRGRSITSLLPVFPSYLFAFLPDEELEVAWKTNRVISILDVSDGDRLVHELRQIRRLIESEVPITIESHILPGDRVRVRLGAFAGMEGTVLVRRGETRLLVSVDFLQRGASIAIDDYMLEPLSYASSRLAATEP
jgi:transcriptional antiterminator RfaH